MHLDNTQKSLQALAESYQNLVDAWRDLWLDAQAADAQAMAEKAKAAFKGNDVKASPSKVAELIAVIAGGYDSPRRLGHLAYYRSTQVPLGELGVTFPAHRTDVPQTSTLRINWANHPSLAIGDCVLKATQDPDSQQVLTLSRFDDKPVIKIDERGLHLEGGCVQLHRRAAKVLGNFKHGMNATYTLMDEIRKKLDIPKS